MQKNHSNVQPTTLPLSSSTVPSRSAPPPLHAADLSPGLSPKSRRGVRGARRGVRGAYNFRLFDSSFILHPSSFPPVLRPSSFVLFVLFLLIFAREAIAGPPFITDDPEPVDLHHWEVYISSVTSHDVSGTIGTAPHVELNNGAAPNLQLHIIIPLAFSRPTGGGFQGGLGDTELGFKYRFLQESAHRPMVGIFPLLEVPTGNADRGLGSGHLQAFLPVWLQKSWNSWTTYGGGGYYINPGDGNSNFWRTGWLLQKDLSKSLTLGNEFLYQTASVVDGPSEFDFNFGGQYNFDEGHHFLFSAGRSISGPNQFMSYLGYQWTFGPREAGPPSAPSQSLTGGPK